MNPHELQDQNLYQVYVFESEEEEHEAALDVNDVTASERKKLKSIRVKENAMFAPEIAIIGYWKQNEMGEYKCYQHFKVPNPVKRDIRKKKDSQLRLSSVLNVGRENEVFFFFKEQKT